MVETKDSEMDDIYGITATGDLRASRTSIDHVLQNIDELQVDSVNFSPSIETSPEKPTRHPYLISLSNNCLVISFQYLTHNFLDETTTIPLDFP